MKRYYGRMTRTEQPMNWLRAFIGGCFASALMMGFIDIFYMFGITPFTFEQYLGQTVNYSAYGVHNWTVGLIASWLLGGLFGLFYAYFFEYVYRRANARVGVRVGFWHAVVAAVAFFPFFNAIREQMGVGGFPHFGFFGVGIGPVTPVVLLMAHLVFGAMMGTFYGPVRAGRIRARDFEPGAEGLAAEPDEVILATPPLEAAPPLGEDRRAG